MDKEREVEKVFDILDRHIMLEHKAFTDNIVGEWDAAKAIIEAGYRKADDVRKETAKEIADWLECQTIDDLGGYRIDKATKLARIIRQKYGVEVDK